jgi:hypothetical protein
MKRILPCLFLALVLAAPAVADDKVTVRTLHGSWSTGTQRIHLEMEPASVTIEPSRDGKLSAEIDVRCDHWRRGCEERAEQVEIEAGSEGNAFRLGVTKMSKSMNRGMSLRAHIYVPRGAAMTIDMGVGELKVNGIENHLDIDVGVGEVSVRLERRTVRSVHVDVGVGEGRIAVAGNDVDSHGWLGKSVDWGRGSGRSNVTVHLGVGEARVKLD